MTDVAKPRYAGHTILKSKDDEDVFTYAQYAAPIYRPELLGAGVWYTLCTALEDARGKMQPMCANEEQQRTDIQLGKIQ